jgi:biopolymer transport protein ExbD
MYDGTYWVWISSGRDANDDNKTAQTATTTNADYEVLFSGTADNTTRTEQARKNSNLKFNPSTGNLQATQLNGKAIGSDPKFTDTTYSDATTSESGLMSASDKTKLNGIATGATANTGTVTSVATGVGLTGGTVTTSGTIKVNLVSETKLNNASVTSTESADRVYPVALDKNGKLAVNVPWTDNNTDTKVAQTATTTSANYEVLFSGTADNTTKTEGARKNNNLLFNPSTGNLQATQLNGVNIGSSPKFTDTTYSDATTSTAGLMSASDKTKLNGIATGATANTGTVTKVSAGAGLKGGDITTSGTVKANLKSETQSTLTASSKGSTANREYAVGLDANGNLSVNIPWTDNNDNNAVTQTATTTNANYEVLFSGTADNTTRTEGARKNSNFKFNPSTGNLTVTTVNGFAFEIV